METKRKEEKKETKSSSPLKAKIFQSEVELDEKEKVQSYQSNSAVMMDIKYLDEESPELSFDEE